MALSQAFFKSFLGQVPAWYKLTIIAFLIINPIIFSINPFIAGWLLIIEFIFTLAMALRCYPLQPGGLLAIEAIAIGMTSSDNVLAEIHHNLEVILLLVFMVAGIYFMKELLMFLFTKLIVRVSSKIRLSIAFCVACAVLSAFLDALTVIAVVISVAIGFYAIYHKVVSGKSFNHDHDHTQDSQVAKVSHDDLEQFRGFLRNLMLHAAIGSALGGVMTLVGEPQNLIIADRAGWGFAEFFLRISPVSIPVFIAGLFTCVMVERLKAFGYGYQLPLAVKQILKDYDTDQQARMSKQDKVVLISQAIIAVWLIVGLALHLAAVGLIGLSIIIFATSAKGVVEEHALGKAFEEALPFTALLTVFFAVVSVINDQQLFSPVIDWALSFQGHTQLMVFYIANGLLSMVSDNVFVGTVYVNELASALSSGSITREQFDLLAVAVNTGTNLPSVATPNGQAAFLFLLTSTAAPLLRLSYGKMVWMALPYTIVLTFVGLFGCYFLLEPSTALLESYGVLTTHPVELVGQVLKAH